MPLARGRVASRSALVTTGSSVMENAVNRKYGVLREAHRSRVEAHVVAVGSTP